ncbi:hypothetical protein MPER_07631 [Moniliophthora perniciosa FA553]|nr:hypothetical protein MPER_07631 [Moniliophthora perniciosa FA553]
MSQITTESSAKPSLSDPSSSTRPVVDSDLLHRLNEAVVADKLVAAKITDLRTAFKTITINQRRAIYQVLNTVLDEPRVKYLRYMLFASPYDKVRGSVGDAEFQSDLAHQSSSAMSYALGTASDNSEPKDGDNDITTNTSPASSPVHGDDEHDVESEFEMPEDPCPGCFADLTDSLGWRTMPKLRVWT